jgi:hypothetical protein
VSGTNKVLIEQLAADLEPVRYLRFRDGVLWVGLSLLATVVAIAFIDGLWHGILHGEASPFFMITNGLLLVLGCASATSVLRMAAPRVGNLHDAPLWAMAMVAVLPFSAVLVLLSEGAAMTLLEDPHGLNCLSAALVSSVLCAATLIFWLRRGAPVSPTRAGLHLGVAATALGSASYGLACPLDSMSHLALWHVAPVVIGGLAGRIIKIYLSFSDRILRPHHAEVIPDDR